MTLLIHLPTPHDHFSPRTGSAVMTVIDGLARGSSARAEHVVLVAHDTYPDRYPSAASVEYPAPGFVDEPRRRTDAALATFGLPRPFERRNYRSAARQLDGLAPGPVLLHNAADPLPMVARRRTTVLYAHNDVLKRLPGWVAAKRVERATAVVAVSEWLGQRMADRLPGRLHDRIGVVLNGVDYQRFAGHRRRPGPLVRVLFLGRVIPEKGVDVLIEALRKLGPAPATLRVVGSAGFDGSASLTPYEQQLRNSAASLRIPVDFQPFVTRDEVPEHYHWADIVVVPSRWDDPCPLSLGEALASGAAVVATRSGGMPEQAGGAALLVPRGDAETLAAALESLIDDPRERALCGARADARGRDLDWTARAPVLLDFLGGRL